MPLTGSLPLATPIKLAVWVDHSLIEVFAMDGLARVSSRIYPGDDSVSWGLTAFVHGAGPAAGVGLEATVWELDNAWQAPECSPEL
jgi:hypothetical protein